MSHFKETFYRLAQGAWQHFDAAIRPFPQNIGPAFTQHYNFVKESQWLSEPELRTYQEKQLAKLLNHAYAHVPYYQRVFNERSLKPRDVATTQDLVKLPLLTKEIIRDNFSDLITKGAEKEFWVESHTSGSTGQPLTFLLEPDSNERELAYMFRAWVFGGYQLGDKVVQLRSFVPKAGAPTHYFDRRNNFLYLSAYHLTEETMIRYTELINHSGAKILRGYPSSVYIFAQFLLSNKIRLVNIETVITSSEMLLPSYREAIEKAFQTKVLDWYGCNERVVTASQCPVNEGYHTNLDYGILEVVDGQGKVIEEGTGELVGTSLTNFVMPLIRYCPNDVVTIQKPKQCSCGRGLPLEILAIEGRSDEILDFFGVKVPPINFYTMFHGILGIVQFQLIQEDATTLTVKVVVDSEYGEEEAKAVEDGLKSRIGARVKVNIEKVSSIKRDEKTSKIKAIINRAKSGR